ncbi:MAG: hypothetical protein GY868_11765 [Deltaproteobacteria bacterium]|nr:hypothetical protein [Deltaproteobacteria bacterium]
MGKISSGELNRPYGWTGSFLRINLSSGETALTGSLDHAENFIGGRLMAARIYWDEVSQATGALEPDNLLMIMPGPLAGTRATACSRWVMSAKSPHSYPDQYGFGNGGGFLGAALKQAGYDGLLISGRAGSLSYVVIENDTVEIRDAAGLGGLASDETIVKLRERHGAGARVVCVGPAGENLVRFAVAVTDQGGTLSNGMGAVMGSKNLKAIVVKGGRRVPVADPHKLKEVNSRARFLRQGLNASLYSTEPMIQGIEYVKPAPCYGCPAGCMRAHFKHTSGREEIRKTCAAAFVYVPWDSLYHGEGTENPFLATSLCNRYGLCTAEVSNILNWLYSCHQKGLLTEAETGLPLSEIGSLAFIEALVELIVTRQGFGELLALGTRRASLEKGGDAAAAGLMRVMPSGYGNDAYGARIFMTTALMYATEARNPIIQLHEVNFTLLKWVLWHTTGGAMSPIGTDDLRAIARRAWGSEQAADFSTYAGKALAAFMIQNRQHAKESMVACDRYYPMLGTSEEDDHIGDLTLVPRMFEAVTGQVMSEDDYYNIGRRSVNLQRAIMAREGRAGRREDSLAEFNFSLPAETCEGVFGIFNPDLELPGSANEVVVRKGATLDRAAFETMKDDYYGLRGWDKVSGLQTETELKKLGLDFVCRDLDGRGFLEKM